MIQLTLITFFGILAIYLLEGNWKAGITLTIVIGFLQDPIRKLTPGQPSWIVGLALISFTLSTLALYSQVRGGLNIKSIVYRCPPLAGMMPVFMYLIAFQFFNSIVRFNDPLKASIGAAFYLAPLAAIWVGYYIGLTEKFLRKILTLYIALSVIFGVSVFISWQGNDSTLLSEVGQGIEIIFRHGFHDQGAPGLWRTSEIAAWQLATAASLSIVLSMGAKDTQNKFLLLFLAVSFGFLTILTGRRKGLAMVIVFVGTYLLLLSRRSTASKRESLVLSALGISGLSFFTFSSLIAPMLGWRFGEYWNRATTIAGDEAAERFQQQGIGAFLRGIEVSDGIGFGLGAGAQTGNLAVANTSSVVQSAGYVSEGGGGRLALELGIPGLVIISIMGILIFLLIVRNYSDLAWLPAESADMRIGLFAILLSNVPFFFSAAQLYSDPFVLIIMSVCFGAYLAVPALSRHFINLQYQEQQMRRLYMLASSTSATSTIT